MRHEVKSPITGSVWLASVSVGQQVVQGSPLVVLECMKMEIPVESPVDGTVLEVLPSGSAINEGDVVAVVES